MSSQYIWPLSKSSIPDQMNTSFGPRIDADEWDFHDGIYLPAPALKSSNGSAAVEINLWRNWRLHLLRLGTRETTAVVFLDSQEVVRLDWDTVGVQLLRFADGIASIPAKASGTILCDELRLAEDTL